MRRLRDDTVAAGIQNLPQKAPVDALLDVSARPERVPALDSEVRQLPVWYSEAQEVQVVV